MRTCLRSTDTLNLWVPESQFERGVAPLELSRHTISPPCCHEFDASAR
jgi:hypothetical protein